MRFVSQLHFLNFTLFFFFNDTATTEIYTLSLHDALPICLLERVPAVEHSGAGHLAQRGHVLGGVAGHDQATSTGDRKSTRLNSSHANISYAVFCLKKKKSTSTVAQHARDL